MTKNTTFKEYKKTHPLGNYELYTEALRKVLLAEFNANRDNPKKRKKALKTLIVARNCSLRSVNRLSSVAEVSAFHLIDDLEKLGFFVNENSVLSNEVIRKLTDFSPVYKASFSFILEL